MSALLGFGLAARKRGGGHDHPRRAVAALEGLGLEEGRLHGWSLPSRSSPSIVVTALPAASETDDGRSAPGGRRPGPCRRRTVPRRSRTWCPSAPGGCAERRAGSRRAGRRRSRFTVDLKHQRAHGRLESSRKMGARARPPGPGEIQSPEIHDAHRRRERNCGARRLRCRSGPWHGRRAGGARDEVAPFSPRSGRRWEVILVDDGSPESGWKRIEGLARQEPRVRGIDAGRNYGQHNALLCGLRAAAYDTTVTMDDDLQHPPEEIPRLLARLDEGWDLVYGTPRGNEAALLAQGRLRADPRRARALDRTREGEDRQRVSRAAHRQPRRVRRFPRALRLARRAPELDDRPGDARRGPARPAQVRERRATASGSSSRTRPT